MLSAARTVPQAPGKAGARQRGRACDGGGRTAVWHGGVTASSIHCRTSRPGLTHQPSCTHLCQQQLVCFSVAEEAGEGAGRHLHIAVCQPHVAPALARRRRQALPFRCSQRSMNDLRPARAGRHRGQEAEGGRRLRKGAEPWCRGVGLPPPCVPQTEGGAQLWERRAQAAGSLGSRQHRGPRHPLPNSCSLDAWHPEGVQTRGTGPGGVVSVIHSHHIKGSVCRDVQPAVQGGGVGGQGRGGAGWEGEG